MIVPTATAIETVPVETYRAVLAERDQAEARADALAVQVGWFIHALDQLGNRDDAFSHQTLIYVAELRRRVLACLTENGYPEPSPLEAVEAPAG